jgi:hypothetical protein
MALNYATGETEQTLKAIMRIGVDGVIPPPHRKKAGGGDF